MTQAHSLSRSMRPGPRGRPVENTDAITKHSEVSCFRVEGVRGQNLDPLGDVQGPGGGEAA